jgi:hypothetical protein
MATYAYTLADHVSMHACTHAYTLADHVIMHSCTHTCMHAHFQRRKLADHLSLGRGRPVNLTQGFGAFQDPYLLASMSSGRIDPGAGPSRSGEGQASPPAHDGHGSQPTTGSRQSREVREAHQPSRYASTTHMHALPRAYTCTCVHAHAHALTCNE